MLEYQVDKVSLSALKDIECVLEHRMEAGTLCGCRNFEGCKDIAWMQDIRGCRDIEWTQEY